MFENIKQRYQMGWIRVDQLKRYVQLQVITKDEYKLICGEKYVSN